MKVNLRETAAHLRKLADALEECEANEFYGIRFHMQTNNADQFDEVKNVLSRVFPEARIETRGSCEHNQQRVLCLVDPLGTIRCPLDLSIVDMSKERV